MHKATVSACVRVTQWSSGEVKQEVRTFATTTPELLVLRAWLSEQRVTHVRRWKRPGCTGSRSTTCWKTASELPLVNPAYFGQVLGRKTDVADLRVAGTVSSSTDCCAAALYRQRRFATARPYPLSREP